jgi:hypothetical protein
LSLSSRFSTSRWWANRVCYGRENMKMHFRHQQLSQNEIMGFQLPYLVVTEGYILNARLSLVRMYELFWSAYCGLEVSYCLNIYANASYLSVRIQFWATNALCT